VLPAYFIRCFNQLAGNSFQPIEIVDRLIKPDAVIATGSNNSFRYFEYYFSFIPHLLRRNRSSLAALTGAETNRELQNLADDIFRYFGLGCRNVSKLFVPQGYDFAALFDSMEGWKNITDHHKYRNNLDFRRAVFLLNAIPHLTNNFILVTEEKNLFSPVSVLHYEKYSSAEDLSIKIREHEGDLQCRVGTAQVPFGQTQQPSLSDYADGIDTMQFLLGLYGSPGRNQFA
jgi:hypothetical protein